MPAAAILYYPDMPRHDVTIFNAIPEDTNVSVQLIGAQAAADAGTAVSTVTGVQELRDLGYLLVDDYVGVDPLGVGDSLSGINECMLDAKRDRKSVIFSANATYRVSGAILMGMWDQFDQIQVFGLGDGDNRPQIVLDDGATGFSDTGNPRPVICFRLLDGLADETWPSDPMNNSGSNEGSANIAFYFNLSNIRVDCGVNDGAFGMYLPAAQRSFASNLEVDCSSALGGVWGLLGRNSPIMGLKVIGGVWQIRNESRTEEASAGSLVCGLELVGDSRTTDPIQNDDFVPLTVVGFDLTRTTSGSFWTADGHSRTGYGNVVLIDGIIRSAGGTVIDNANGKTCHLHNVYVTGTNDLIQSGAEAIITAAGTWKLISDYTYNDPTTYNSGAAQYPAKSLIDGTVSAAVEPDTDVSASVSAPTVDYIARHTISIPRVDSGPYINILDYGATVNPDGLSNLIANDGTAGSTTAIENAIAAAKIAGHNTVVVPRGAFYLDRVLTLDADTILIGVGSRMSLFVPQNDWNPTSKTFMVQSADDANGASHISQIGMYARTVSGSFTSPSGPYAFDNFSYYNHRTGKNSSSIVTYNGREFMNNTYKCGIKAYHQFDGNAGGKHYGMTDVQGRRYGNADARGFLISGTSQPLHLYGVNPEVTKSSVENCDWAMEVVNCSNLRMYGCKREGTSPTILINDSLNVAFYGLGRQDASTSFGFVVSIQGTSDNIQIAPIMVDGSGETYNGNDMLSESLDAEAAVAVAFPEAISIYRRGTLDDAAATI